MFQLTKVNKGKIVMKGKRARKGHFNGGPLRTLNNPAYGKQHNMIGISQEVYAVMAYTQVYPFTAGAVGVFGSEQVWNLNSTFDIDLTGGGHQPYMRDTYAALYNKYKVNAVKIDVTCSDPSADAIVCAFAICSPGDATTLAGITPNTAGERPNVALKYINNTGKQVVVYKRFKKIGDISGLTRLQFAADLLSYNANSGADPSAIPKLRVAIADLRSVVASTIVMTFRFTQYVKWYDRIIQAQS